VAQSVELLLDRAADSNIRDQWAALKAAGLPSEQRSGHDLTHGPHITLYAADRIDPGAEAPLTEVVAGLDLEVVIGSLLIFGPRRGRSVLVRTVVPSPALLALQAQVATACAADPLGHFGPGRWSPHVTLARRVPNELLGAAVDVLGDHSTMARVTSCRRWDGTAKRAWRL
jgi:2'-5' RNA ligase